jgi:hypothetical protein
MGLGREVLAGDRGYLPEVEEDLAEFLDGEGGKEVGGEPVVGGLFGLAGLVGFEAEGDGADDGDAEGFGFSGVEVGEGEVFGLGCLGVEGLGALGVLLMEGGFSKLGVLFALFVMV